MPLIANLEMVFRIFVPLVLVAVHIGIKFFGVEAAKITIAYIVWRFDVENNPECN